jgi:thiol-disulfide isomerase/thioredoxin
MIKQRMCLALLIVFISTMACSQKPNLGQPDVDFKEIEKNFVQWWTYQSNNITLSSNFIAIDDSSKIMSKGDFLKKLTSGDYIPLKLISEDSIACYKLFKLDKTSDADIRSTIENTSYSEYIHFKMEGKNFPKFNFKDLNGIEYNNENTKGKIVILKCWFIACQACVAEFPELNELVQKYQNHNDILFISLAYDSKEELNQFLSKKHSTMPWLPTKNSLYAMN